MGWVGPFRILNKMPAGYTYQVEKAGRGGATAFIPVSNMIKAEDPDRAPEKPKEMVEEEKERSDGEMSEGEEEEEMEEVEKEAKLGRGEEKKEEKKKGGEEKE